MKEAAGEANMTIVTIVLIAIVLGAGTLVVTNLVKGMKTNNSTLCANNGYSWNGSKCVDASGKCYAITNGNVATTASACQ